MEDFPHNDSPINYDRVMRSQIESLCGGGGAAGKPPDLLLHVCCAPCSSAVIERLAPFFTITLFFYNPNIHPRREYEKRLSVLRAFAPALAAAENTEFPVVEGPYEPEVFYRETGVREEPSLQGEGERGERCRRCCRFRLRAAFGYAKTRGIGAVTTTLSLSPRKDARAINAIGLELEAQCAPVRFLCADFKKRDGYKRSLELSKAYGLYRQTYCGCEYSLGTR
ncbi:MAG: epoxyqueuosine reductase QueH [Spirochaetaceae bacterium]|jgi:predicted adenine nucleotide alpha hydrolase (AANH) superfamily ATPase|nr:epoxyqueuosine reductase QueH [Spirochaetaceae bacterium]